MILAVNIEAAFALSSATQPNSPLLWKRVRMWSPCRWGPLIMTSIMTLGLFSCPSNLWSPLPLCSLLCLNQDWFFWFCFPLKCKMFLSYSNRFLFWWTCEQQQKKPLCILLFDGVLWCCRPLLWSDQCPWRRLCGAALLSLQMEHL